MQNLCTNGNQWLVHPIWRSSLQSKQACQWHPGKLWRSPKVPRNLYNVCPQDSRFQQKSQVPVRLEGCICQWFATIVTSLATKAKNCAAWNIQYDIYMFQRHIGSVCPQGTNNLTPFFALILERITLQFNVHRKFTLSWLGNYIIDM